MILRPDVCILALVVSCSSVLAAADEARGLAVDILDRAAAVQHSESSLLLKNIALHLKVGNITVAEAADLVGLMQQLGQLTGPPPVARAVPPASTIPSAEPAAGHQPPPPLSGADIDRLLDVPPTTVIGAPPAPTPPTAAVPPTTGTAPAPPAEAGNSSAPPLPELIATVVRAAELGEGDITLIVNKGTKDGIQRLQRYRIERHGTPVVLAIVSNAQETMAGLQVLKDTWFPRAEGVDKSVHEGDLAILDKQP